MRREQHDTDAQMLRPWVPVNSPHALLKTNISLKATINSTVNRLDSGTAPPTTLIST